MYFLMVLSDVVLPNIEQAVLASLWGFVSEPTDDDKTSVKVSSNVMSFSLFRSIISFR